VAWEPEYSEGVGLTLMKSPLKFQREIVVVINIIIEFLA
jgi:type IV secretory pathway VirB2 component (pilin)